MRKRDAPLVSVIISTYISARTLPMTLWSTKRQTYPNIEVIIVDKHSRDSTPHIVSRFGARLIQGDTERAEAKNIGLKAARGQYVLFRESDIELTPTVIENTPTCNLTLAIASGSFSKEVSGSIRIWH